MDTGGNNPDFQTTFTNPVTNEEIFYEVYIVQTQNPLQEWASGHVAMS
jgi:hypothetical protein